MRHLFFLSMAVLFLLLTKCSQDIASGGGGETTNGIISGIIIHENGNPAPNTQVVLVPHEYNPVADGSLPLSFIQLTNNNGEYTFIVSDTGVFNVQAVHLSQQTRTLITGVHSNNDTTIVQTGTLKVSGSIKVFLPDSADLEQGYIYIPGTTISLFLMDTHIFVLLDSVPAGTMHLLRYGVKNSSIQKIIRYNIPVYSGDTAIVTVPTWNYSKELFLNTTTTGAGVYTTVTDFPVLVRLTSGTFNFTEAKTSGDDIRFTKNDNTLLPYEIENWDESSMEAAIWVKVDTVFGDNNLQSIHMAWGNQAAAGMSNASAVFDTNNAYRGVWHLNNDFQDATLYNNDGTNFGTEDTAGAIGYSKKFDGTDSIRIPGLAGKPQSITLSAWARLEMADDSGSEVISVGNAVLLRMDDTRFNNTYGPMASFHANNTHYDFVFRQYLAKTGWHHIAFTVDNTTFKQAFYIDGELRDSGNVAYPLDYTGVGQNIVIGVHGDKQADVYNFTGLIDEVRVCSTPHSADYLKLCYMNQRENDALIQFK